MGNITFLIAFCFFLPRVIALHTPGKQKDSPRSFVSKSKLFCAEATQSIATDALKLFKSMPRGKLYDGSTVNLDKSCQDLGYKQKGGEDSCYPGLQTFYRNNEEKGHFDKEVEKHLKEYGENNSLTVEDANFSDTCQCREESHAKNNTEKLFKKPCDPKRPSSFVSANKLFCAQAIQSTTMDALSLFKSMPRGKLYNGTIIHLHKSCPQLGYTQSGGDNTCYPGLHTYYRNKQEGERFVAEIQNHLKEYGGTNSLTSNDAIFIDACTCKENSFARNNTEKMFKKVCDNKHPSSFVSKNKLICAQAPQGMATDALNYFKSMPRGKLFDGIMLNLHKSCAELGYTQSGGENTCYPGLHNFIRNKNEGEKFDLALQTHLKEYGENLTLNLHDAIFMDACKCQEKSYDKTNTGRVFKKSCDNSHPTSFVSKSKLFCAEGTYNVATDALNMFKCMPRAKLYDGTILNFHRSCSEMGFKQNAGDNPCYPGLRTFYRNMEEGDYFYTEMQNYLKEFGEITNLTLEDANFVDSCRCQEKSYAKTSVKRKFKKTCDKVAFSVCS